jgi:hypothetical protein
MEFIKSILSSCSIALGDVSSRLRSPLATKAILMKLRKLVARLTSLASVPLELKISLTAPSIKAYPDALSLLGYGSCPNSTNLTSSLAKVLKALKIFVFVGM